MPDSEESDSEDECIPSDRAVNGCGDKAAVAQKSVTKDGVCPSLSSPSPTKGGGDVTADKMTTRLQSKVCSAISVFIHFLLSSWASFEPQARMLGFENVCTKNSSRDAKADV